VSVQIEIDLFCALFVAGLGYGNSRGSSTMLIFPFSQAIRGVWVNIYDFLDAMRDEGICGPDHHFKSQRELSAYTLKTGKIFPKRKAKESGPVRDLLAHIF
jgi:hypothetical protein